MRVPADPGLVRRLSAFASAASVFSIAIGLSGLAGWLLRLSPLTNWGFAPVKMVANTSACFILLGTSLWLLRTKGSQPVSPPHKLAAKTAASLAAAVGLLSLAEHVFTLNLGIDQILLHVPVADHAAGLRPGLMSSLTAVDFLLLGLALLLLDWKTRSNDWPAQFLCLSATIPVTLGVFALVLAPGTAPTSMAWPSAVTFLILMFGLVCSRSTWAFGGLLTSPSPAARLLRAATPASMIVLSLIGWFISKPLLAEQHFTWIDVSVLGVFASVALVGVIAWMSFVVERGNLERLQAESALPIAQAQPNRDRIDDPESEKRLPQRANWAFAVALLLTGLLGLLSWHNAERAAQDADWIAHTRQVSTTLELTLRHLLDVETGGRGFAFSGNERFLEPYTAGRIAVGQDLRALRILIVDQDQKARLDILARLAAVRIQTTDESIAMRRSTGKPATNLELEHGKKAMDEVRDTVAEMESREKTLLEERTARLRGTAHLTTSVIALGSFLGVVFLAIAGFTVTREIGISARARAQLNALNAELEQRVAERTAALGESEGRLAGVIQSAMDAILSVDEQQNIVMFNSAAERMFLCPAAEALGKPLTRFIPHRFHAAHAGHIRKFADTGVTNRAMDAKNALWAARADGQEFQIEASISQVVTGGRKLFTVILRDVTERVQAESLREHLASVVDSSDDAIISKDLNGMINAWNRGAEKIFGYPHSEAVGKPMLMLFPPELVKEEVGILQRIGRGESVEHFETVRVRKDGTRIDVSVTISPIRDASGNVIGASKIARDITERRLKEDELRESEDLFRLFVEHAPAALAMFDREMRYVQMSRRWRTDYGLGNDLQGRSQYDVFPNIAEEWKQAHRRALAGEVLRGESDRFDQPNGDERWRRWEMRPWRDRTGDIAGIVIFAEDITERKQAQDALRESEERFQAMANGIPQLAWIADPDGHIFWYNQRWYEYTGTTFAEMEGWAWQKVHDPKVLPTVMERWQSAIASGEPFEMEFPLRGSDGVFREFLTRINPLKDAAGRVTRWFGTNTDISVLKAVEGRLFAQAAELSRQTTELLRSQTALETQTVLLKLVLESMGEGLVAADLEGRFLLWNGSATKLLSRDAANLPPEQWSSHYACYLPDGITPCPTKDLPLLRAINGESVQTELIIRQTAGERDVFVEFYGRPMKDAAGNLCGGVVAFRDITERRAAEREIQELNQSLEEKIAKRTEQLQAANRDLESFTYSVSHDLRAPLRHIQGFAVACLEEFGATLDPQALHYLQRIQEGTRRMGLLTDELLNLARTGQRPLSVRLTALNPIVEEIISMLGAETTGREVEWKIGILPSVECDPVLVRQIFQNLLSNAIKYSRTRPHALIEIGHTLENDKPVIFVRDNGVGFNMKYADKLFGVFQRLHRAEDFEGTGVGLATVHRIVQKHGGRIWAEAALDHGATFYFTLGSIEHAASRADSATAGA